jgi:two-component system sensor histidine kinase YesM
MEQNVEEQRQKRKSELKALQAQINPHFLYNTLDSIIWMAEWGKNKEVVLMTSSLAKLLRQSISNQNELVRVEEEVEYTRSYLTIQKMRYKDKLEYEIQVDEEVLGKKIPKLVLQPLVENAIYHGIKYKETKGLVRIEGYRDGPHMVLKVSDDGIGMTEEQLSKIFEKREIDTRRNGVGVLNVHERIQLYHGKEYGLKFHSKEGQGTMVEVHIPWEEGGAGTAYEIRY